MDAIHSTYFRVFTLKEANDILVNEIAKLSIFKFYSLTDYGILASVDGQKVETKYQTFISRHSKKYFGFEKVSQATAWLPIMFPLVRLLAQMNMKAITC